MMNLEKMKQKKSKNSVKKGLLAATTFLCLTTPLLQTQTAYAAENTTPAITIEKPDGWKQGETTITVTVDASHMPEGFSIAMEENFELFVDDFINENKELFSVPYAFFGYCGGAVLAYEISATIGV